MKKIFTKASEINFLMLLISYLVYPMSLVFVKLKIKPNSITCVSLLLAIYASYQFILGNFKDFTIFWILSILLDFCDGQVARISKIINKTAFNFDPLSDLLKIFIIILSSAIYYNYQLYWIISCLSVFLFFFHEVLFVYLINLKQKNSLFKAFFSSSGFSRKILARIVHFFFKIDGHSILLFLLLALNLHIALLTMLYMQFILLLNILRLSYLLIKSNAYPSNNLKVKY
jgi:phosphatidylglycerophosphate synthase